MSALNDLEWLPEIVPGYDEQHPLEIRAFFGLAVAVMLQPPSDAPAKWDLSQLPAAPIWPHVSRMCVLLQGKPDEPGCRCKRRAVFRRRRVKRSKNL